MVVIRCDEIVIVFDRQDSSVMSWVNFNVFFGRRIGRL